MTQQKILIASGSGDSPNFGTVAKILTEKGFKVVLFAPDMIARGTQQFTAAVEPQGNLTFVCDGQPFNPAEFAAAWYRKPDFYGQHTDRFRWLSIKEEYRALEEVLWEYIPANIWLNNPLDNRRASKKLPQLEVAASLGFTIPRTIISNSWQEVEKLPDDDLIVKMTTPIILPDGKGNKLMPTTIVQRDKLPKQALPYPGIWQPYFEKKREWRVTVVGRKVFAVSIYTQKTAKDDWRVHQFTDGAVTFKDESFPEAEQQKCFALLDHYNLRFGAFDFIETPAGEMIFLEVNPNGQFMWGEMEHGMPISAAIADELMTIARQGRDKE